MNNTFQQPLKIFMNNLNLMSQGNSSLAPDAKVKETVNKQVKVLSKHSK